MDSAKLLLLATLPCLAAAQTSVTLSTSPNPSRFGAPVTLTATVKTNATTFSQASGRITFYDGVTVLGTAPLASGAASTTTILLPAGGRRLRAYFAGDANTSPATSGTVTQTVNASPASNFAFGSGLVNVADYQPFTADFNGDGIADFTSGGQSSGGLPASVFLGDGKGGIQKSFEYPSGYVLAVGDFNGDGKPDLVILDFPTSDYYLFKFFAGNGDGTFQAPVTTAIPALSSLALTAVVGDFNGDGKADLAGGYGVLLGNGDGTFRRGASMGPVGAIVAGDFNGDGITDLATSDGVNPRLNIFLGSGDGTFQSAIQVPLTGVPGGLAAGDFNRDGKSDLAAECYTYSGAVLNILLSQGDGTFQPPTIYTVPVENYGLVLTGDFNGDGNIDLAVNGNILAGNGVGTFQPLFSFVSGLGSHAAILDLNGDGRPDFVFGDGTILLGTATAIVPSGGTPQSAGAGTQFPAPLEVTVLNNGLPVSGELVTYQLSYTGPQPGPTATLSSNTAVTNAYGVASVTATANHLPGSYTVQAIYQTRIALFSLTNVVGPPASLTAPGALPQTTTIDTPFPNVLTVAVKDSGGNPVRGATVTFQAPQSGASATLSSSTRVTDASGAASVAATANHTPGTYTVTASVGGLSVGFSLTNTLAMSSTLTLTSAASTSTFGAPVVLTASVTPSYATGRVTFYDGVSILGTKPLSAGTATLSTILLPAGTRKLRAFYGGDLSFAAGSSNVLTERVNAAAGGSFAAPTPLNVPPGGAAVVADFNGDGRADIAYSSGSLLIVLLGKGDGSFQAPIQSPGVGGILAVGDFNGDGIPDIFARGDILVTKATVMLGNGDGTFRSGASYSALNYPIFVADFNGDGNADLLIGNLTLIGNGDGTFTPRSFSTDAVTYSEPADFNGDGKPDLAVLTGSCVTQGGLPPESICTGSLYAYIGNGDGTFQSPHLAASATVTFAEFGVFGSSIGGFALGDFNGDGRQDLLYWSSGLTLLPGNGDGTFGPPQTTNTAVTSVTAGDFNGDGITDLAAVNGDTFFILAGKGDGTFQPAGKLYSSSSPSLVVADFNGDGKADLLVGNGGNYSVYLGAAAGTGLTITATGGTPQSTPIGAFFSAPLEVTLLNNGIPVSGATVTFAPVAPSQATAILLSTTAITNASGVARTMAYASEYPGTYVVNAAAQGVIASFKLTNAYTGYTIGSVTPASGTPQSTVVGAAFPVALQARVTDNTVAPPKPISGIVVKFSAPAIGASAALSSATAVTDASGLAAVTATANGSLGAYNVTASVGTGLISTQFALTNTPGGGASNLALGKPATQSSTLPGYPSAAASFAVDGNTNGSFFGGSVTATNADPNAWWQVDLGASAAVSSVAIFNRTDCCAARLSDYWVFISNTPFLATDTPATLQNRAGTFSSHQTLTPNPSAMIAAGGAQGRYVRVQLSDTDYLSLAEVQVFGAGGTSLLTNLALAGTATQSSTFPGYSSAGARSAIDGNTDGVFSDGSVTATNADGNSWWQVDLGASYAIDSVLVWNRTDCCASRLSDYWLIISNTPFLPTDTPSTLENRAKTYLIEQTSAPNPSATIQAYGQLGRYVRVQSANGGYLSLAEVQVYGAPVANLALGKAAMQSSTLPGYPTAGAAAAVDGGTDGNFNDGSVTATNADANPWWELDLGAPVPISAIVIWNRTDCCAARLSDYYIFISDTPFGPADTPATLPRVGDTFIHQTTAPNPSTTLDYLVGAHGRYVRVQLAGTAYLSLAEFQVFGPGGAPNANLAKGKAATESSTLPGTPTAGAASAVDGNSDGNFFDGSVTATNLDAHAWWEVDLGASATIGSVEIDNRTDCCGARLGDYWVFISDTPFLATDTAATLQNRAGTFASHQTTAPGPSATVLAGVRGRYVRVQLTGTDYLSLAEVRVFGQ